MTGHVAVRFSRCFASQTWVIGMVTDVAQELRMAGYVASGRAVQTQLTDVVREVRVPWNVTQQSRMRRYGANGLRQGTAGADQQRIIGVVGNVAHH